MNHKEWCRKKIGLIPKSIDKIIQADLQALVDNAVLEHKTIEYKQSLPDNSDADKKEFLADVSSFANASGGDLVFGIIQEKTTGEPRKVEGVDVENVDQEILRLESIVRDGIEPRIPALQTISIALSNSKTVIVMRIPRSWISPHRVSFKGWDKFYSRSSNGKYPLDVSELRIAFNMTETVTEKIRQFRESRISSIFANETPIPFYDNAKIILHLIPIASFNPAQRYDMSGIASTPTKLPPMNCSEWTHRYNLDGFLAYSGGREGKSHSYIQLFRNGIIEAVDGLMLMPHGGELIIPSIAYEEELIHSLSEYLTVLKTLGVALPILVFVTLVGVKGYSMPGDIRWRLFDSVTIDRSILLLPEVIIESYDTAAKDVLKPCFDSIWNACGFPRSLNYNDAGEWKKG